VKAFGGGVFVSGLKMNLYHAMKPLLLKQSYIENVLHISETELPVGFVDLNIFRMHPEVDKIHLVDAHLESFRLPRYDWSQGGWLEIPCNDADWGFAVISKTPRYLDKSFNWKKEVNYLRKYFGEYVYFMGLQNEYVDFIKKYGHVHLHKSTDFLEAAQIIYKADTFTGNQSVMMAIRQGLGLPYRLHRSPYMANCNQWSKNETIINPVSRKIHILGAAVKKVMNNA
jgi:hypothetical protein